MTRIECKRRDSSGHALDHCCTRNLIHGLWTPMQESVKSIMTLITVQAYVCFCFRKPSSCLLKARSDCAVMTHNA